MPVPELKGKITIDANDVDQASDKMRDFEKMLGSFFARQSGGARRAELAITASIRDLVSGDYLGAAENLLGRISALGLAGGVAVGVVGTALIKGYKELQAFNKELENTGKLLAKMPQAGASVEALKGHVTELLGAIKPKTEGGPGFLANVVDLLKSGFRDSPQSAQAQGVLQHKQAIDQIVRSLEAQQAKTVAVTEAQKAEAALAEKIAAINQGQSVTLSEIVSKQLKIADASKLTKEVNAAAQAERDRALKEAVAPFEKALKEKTGVTAEELMAAGQLAPNRGFQTQRRQAFPVALQGDAYMLGIANRAQAEGERLRGLGFPKQAEQYFRQAADIRGKIESLKPSEKEDVIALKGALDASEVLKKIAGATTETAEKVGKIDFTNK